MTQKKRVIAHDTQRGKVLFDGPVKRWASIKRFNGKRGGYAIVQNADGTTPSDDLRWNERWSPVNASS